MRKVGLIFAFGLLLCVSQAYAQMYRCTGAGGKTTYSNFPCSEGEKVEHVRITDNAIESRELRNYASDLKEREFVRKYREQEMVSEASSGDSSKLGSYECNLAIKNANNQSTIAKASSRKIADDRAKAVSICGADPWSDDMRSRRLKANARAAERDTAIENAPQVVTSCDSAGCWDTRGRRYNGTGDGSHFHRQDGKFCQKIGNQLMCN